LKPRFLRSKFVELSLKLSADILKACLLLLDELALLAEFFLERVEPGATRLDLLEEGLPLSTKLLGRRRQGGLFGVQLTAIALEPVCQILQLALPGVDLALTIVEPRLLVLKLSAPGGKLLDLVGEIALGRFDRFAEGAKLFSGGADRLLLAVHIGSAPVEVVESRLQIVALFRDLLLPVAKPGFVDPYGAADAPKLLALILMVIVASVDVGDRDDLDLNRTAVDAVTGREARIAELSAVEPHAGRGATHDGRLAAAQNQALNRPNAGGAKPERATPARADRTFRGRQANQLIRLTGGAKPQDERRGRCPEQ
jgi:hypothetical protein